MATILDSHNVLTPAPTPYRSRILSPFQKEYKNTTPISNLLKDPEPQPQPQDNYETIQTSGNGGIISAKPISTTADVYASKPRFLASPPPARLNSSSASSSGTSMPYSLGLDAEDKDHYLEVMEMLENLETSGPATSRGKGKGPSLFDNIRATIKAKKNNEKGKEKKVIVEEVVLPGPVSGSSSIRIGSVEDEEYTTERRRSSGESHSQGSSVLVVPTEEGEGDSEAGGEEEEDTIWHSYPPPSSLTHLQDDLVAAGEYDDIVRLIANVSVSNVRERVRLALEEKNASEEAEKVREEAERKAKELRDGVGVEVASVSPSHGEGDMEVVSPVSLIGDQDSGINLGVGAEGTGRASLDSRGTGGSAHGVKETVKETVKGTTTRLTTRLGRLLLPSHNRGGSINRIDLALGVMMPIAIPSAKPEEVLPGPGGKRWSLVDGRKFEEKQEELFECVACLEDFPITTTLKLPCHHYCHPCFVRLIETASQTESRWPPQCCLTPIPIATILTNVGGAGGAAGSGGPGRAAEATLRKTVEQRNAEWSVPASDRVYCSRSKCSTFIPIAKINKSTKIATCPKCSKKTCTMCRGDEHPIPSIATSSRAGGSATATHPACPQDKEAKMTLSLASDLGWQPCPSCRVIVEHKEACQHMTCRCGAQFCYVCGKRWRTCSCSASDLTRRKAAAGERRRERKREEREADEAVRLVEEFEAEERRKEGLREKERRRVEREERREARRGRIAGEVERRGVVRGKWEGVREGVGRVCEGQGVGLGGVHDGDVNALNVNLARERAKGMKLVEGQDKAFRESMDLMTREAQEVLDRQWANRKKAEREDETTYTATLTTFFQKHCKHPDHVAPHVEARIVKWREAQKAKMDLWLTWRDDQLSAKREEASNQIEVATQASASTLRYIEAELDQRREADAARRIAEWKWFAAVLLERAGMMERMEEEEIALGDGVLHEPEEVSSEDEDEEVVEPAKGGGARKKSVGRKLEGQDFAVGGSRGGVPVKRPSFLQALFKKQGVPSSNTALHDTVKDPPLPPGPFQEPKRGKRKSAVPSAGI